jgi:hypothetical protein
MALNPRHGTHVLALTLALKQENRVNQVLWQEMVLTNKSPGEIIPTQATGAMKRETVGKMHGKVR